MNIIETGGDAALILIALLVLTIVVAQVSDFLQKMFKNHHTNPSEKEKKPPT